MATSKEDLADIMLFYVEMGVKFTNAYGDIDEAFYCSMESMYEQAIKYICEQGLQEQFISRCAKIVEDTDGIGWGFNDTLYALYNEYLGQYDNGGDKPFELQYVVPMKTSKIRT